jgi:hypothetical protein
MANYLTAPILSKLTVDCPFREIFDDTEPTEGSIISYPRSKICHIRADHDGWRWYNTVWPCHDELATPEMKREIDATYEELTARDALRNLALVARYCVSHPEARCSSSQTEYDFYLEGELCNYWLRLITRPKDYNIYLNAYAKRRSDEAD